MSLHVHIWDAAGGSACGACGEYRPPRTDRPAVYHCDVEGCDYAMWDPCPEDVADHFLSDHPLSNNLSLGDEVRNLEAALVRAVGSLHSRGDHGGAWNECPDPACRDATVALAGYLMDVGSA